VQLLLLLLLFGCCTTPGKCPNALSLCSLLPPSAATCTSQSCATAAAAQLCEVLGQVGMEGMLLADAVEDCEQRRGEGGPTNGPLGSPVKL